MKGLLLKDTYIAAKLCKAFIFIDILAVALGGKNVFFVFYACMISSMIPMTLISYDEREKWDTYAGTLPYTRAQIVSSKYVMGLCANVIVLALVAIGQAVQTVSGGVFALKEYAAGLLLLLSVSLIAPSILYPLVFKYGAEKGRIFYYIIIGLSCAGGTIVSNAGMEFALASNGSAAITAFVIVALAYLASWLLSIRFYNKREL